MTSALVRPRAEPACYNAEATLDLGSLAPGRYELRAVVLAPDGTEAGRVVRPLELLPEGSAPGQCTVHRSDYVLIALKSGSTGPRRKAQDVGGCTMVSYRSRALRPAAAFGLAVMLGGLTLPLVGLVLADEPAPFCCSKGRCCCADVAPSTDEGPCLRRGCGCGRPDGLVTGAPLRIEAVLSTPAPVAHASPAEARWEIAAERPVARAHEPPVPPPRSSLPA
jgi:hypothetical protein